MIMDFGAIQLFLNGFVAGAAVALIIMMWGNRD